MGGLGGADEGIRTYHDPQQPPTMASLQHLQGPMEQQTECQRITADRLAHSSGHLVRGASRFCFRIRRLFMRAQLTAALAWPAQTASSQWHAPPESQNPRIRACRRLRCSGLRRRRDQPPLLVQTQAVGEIREPRGNHDPAACSHHAQRLSSPAIMQSLRHGAASDPREPAVLPSLSPPVALCVCVSSGLQDDAEQRCASTNVGRPCPLARALTSEWTVPGHSNTGWPVGPRSIVPQMCWWSTQPRGEGRLLGIPTG